MTKKKDALKKNATLKELGFRPTKKMRSGMKPSPGKFAQKFPRITEAMAIEAERPGTLESFTERVTNVIQRFGGFSRERANDLARDWKQLIRTSWATAKKTNAVGRQILALDRGEPR